MSNWDVLLSEVQKAYFAGLFDGEGTVQLRLQRNRTTYSMSINVTCGTHAESMQQFGALFRKNLIPVKVRSHEKPCWRLQLSSRQALSFLEQIEPYVKIKRKQMELAVRFQRRKRRISFCGEEQRQQERLDKEELLRLNKRGTL